MELEPNKKTSSKYGDVLNKVSLFLSFISLLLIVALFLRMETEMNKLRISNVQSGIQIGSPQTTDYKNEMETFESEYPCNPCLTVRFINYGKVVRVIV